MMRFYLTSPGPSHIVPVLVGDAALAKAASDKLLADHDIYVQSINYPTVAVGEERLRITVTPRHTLEQMDKLVRAVNQTFTELKINRLSDWKAAGGRAGVGLPESETEFVEPMWNDEQLGYNDGTTPRMLHDGHADVIDAKGVAAARSRFNVLLGPVTGPLQPNRDTDGSAVNAMLVNSVSNAATTMPMGGEEVMIPVPKLVSAAA